MGEMTSGHYKQSLPEPQPVPLLLQQRVEAQQVKPDEVSVDGQHLSAPVHGTSPHGAAGGFFFLIRFLFFSFLGQNGSGYRGGTAGGAGAGGSGGGGGPGGLPQLGE